MLCHKWENFPFWVNYPFKTDNLKKEWWSLLVQTYHIPPRHSDHSPLIRNRWRRGPAHGPCTCRRGYTALDVSFCCFLVYLALPVNTTEIFSLTCSTTWLCWNNAWNVTHVLFKQTLSFSISAIVLSIRRVFVMKVVVRMERICIIKHKSTEKGLPHCTCCMCTCKCSSYYQTLLNLCLMFQNWGSPLLYWFSAEVSLVSLQNKPKKQKETIH